jgi:hypothetical protein
MWTDFLENKAQGKISLTKALYRYSFQGSKNEEGEEGDNVLVNHCRKRICQIPW